MADESIEVKVGKLETRMTQVDSNLRDIKKNTDEISKALNKGKGIFFGLIIAAASIGGMSAKFINFVSTEIK